MLELSLSNVESALKNGTGSAMSIIINVKWRARADRNPELKLLANRPSDHMNVQNAKAQKRMEKPMAVLPI